MLQIIFNHMHPWLAPHWKNAVEDEPSSRDMALGLTQPFSVALIGKIYASTSAAPLSDRKPEEDKPYRRRHSASSKRYVRSGRIVAAAAGPKDSYFAVVG